LVTYTSSPTYWAPLKPRIRIYAFNDTSYSSPLYTYNAFTDVGVTTKPVQLLFDTQTANVGTFSIEIEDASSELDLDILTKGNRVFIECSKDGSTWQPAFKGLVRESEQHVYAPSGRNLTINGYSYLVRLNERILNTIREATPLGINYDRTDSTMFTNNLINELLTTDSHYVYSVDDTQLYSIFKNNNISSSPVTEWIPRIDAQLVTLNRAISSILEFSNGILMLDPSNDELTLYTTDLITSGVGTFLITSEMNRNADDADYTMYPLERYRYDISYDFPDSASRLIGSIGSASGCPPIVIPPKPDSPCDNIPTPVAYPFLTGSGPWNNAMRAFEWSATQTTMERLEIKLNHPVDASFVSPPAFSCVVRTKPSQFATPDQGTQVGSIMTLHKDGIPGTAFPNFTSCEWKASLQQDDQGVTGLTLGQNYWLCFYCNADLASYPRVIGLNDMSTTVEDEYMTTGSLNWPNTGGTGWGAVTSQSIRNGPFLAGDITFPTSLIANACGGSQSTVNADPVFGIAHDRNMSNRLGVVERVITGIPTHIKTKQTLNEWLFNRLYVVAKPKFTFDYPSLSMCNKLPKAGDICVHVDNPANVGLRDAPIQTGVISTVRYSFGRGKGQTDVIGLSRLSISTTGIKRGSY
jgi:hypothetical protein